MKSAFTHVIFLLFAIGVFCDAEKAKTVSVIEGESVTLHTDVTEIQSSDVIEWRLNGNRIAKISGDSNITEGPSRDRLKLHKQTGDLTITNIKTTDFGEYKLEISSTRGSSEKTFSVSGSNYVKWIVLTAVGVLVAAAACVIYYRCRKTKERSTRGGEFKVMLQNE